MERIMNLIKETRENNELKFKEMADEYTEILYEKLKVFFSEYPLMAKCEKFALPITKMDFLNKKLIIDVEYISAKIDDLKECGFKRFSEYKGGFVLDDYYENVIPLVETLEKKGFECYCHKYFDVVAIYPFITI